MAEERKKKKNLHHFALLQQLQIQPLYQEVCACAAGVRWLQETLELTKDSSGQPLLMPMVPGSSRRLKSFFWNWKPLTQPLRPTTADSSGLQSNTHTHTRM